MHLKEIAFLARKQHAVAMDVQSMYVRRGSDSVLVIGDAVKRLSTISGTVQFRDSLGHLPNLYTVARPGVPSDRLLSDIVDNEYYDDDDDSDDIFDDDYSDLRDPVTVAYGITEEGLPITDVRDLEDINQVYRRLATTKAIFGLQTGGLMLVEALTSANILVFNYEGGEWECERIVLRFREVCEVPAGSVIKLDNGDIQVTSLERDLLVVGSEARDWSTDRRDYLTAELLLLARRVAGAEESKELSTALEGAKLPSDMVRQAIEGDMYYVEELLRRSGVVYEIRSSLRVGGPALSSLLRFLAEEARAVGYVTTSKLRDVVTRVALTVVSTPAQDTTRIPTTWSTEY